MQADRIYPPVQIWGSVRRTHANQGTWAFYTHDYRFNALWGDPRPVVLSGARVVVEPNFSCYSDTPLVVALWRIYQKRWLARFWQSQGMRIIVDLNVAPQFAEVNLLGVPKGWRIFSTRGYLLQVDQIEREYEIACNLAWPSLPLFYVYGGSQRLRAICETNGWHWLPERADLVKAQRGVPVGVFAESHNG